MDHLDGICLLYDLMYDNKKEYFLSVFDKIPRECIYADFLIEYIIKKCLDPYFYHFLINKFNRKNIDYGNLFALAIIYRRNFALSELMNTPDIEFDENGYVNVLKSAIKMNDAEVFEKFIEKFGKQCSVDSRQRLLDCSHDFDNNLIDLVLDL